MNSKSIKYLMAPLLAFVFVVGVASHAFSEEAKNADDAIPEDSVTDEYEAFRRIVYLQGCKLDAKTAWRWLALAKKLRPDPNSGKTSADSILQTRSIVSQIAALAMVYTGQSNVFRSELMPNIINLEAFKNWVYEPCDECDGVFLYSYDALFGSAKAGTGKVKEKCSHCKGTGQCTNNGCHGGQIEIAVKTFGSSTTGAGGVAAHKYKKCESCRGAGRCRYCEGTGYQLKTCPKCNGKGFRMSKDHIAHVFGVLLPHATDAFKGDIDKMAADRKRKEDEKKVRTDPRSAEVKAHDKTNEYVWAKADFDLLKKLIRVKRKTVAVNVDVSAVSNKNGIDWNQMAASLQADIQGQLGELEYLRPVSSNRDLIDFINTSFDSEMRRTIDVPDYILLGRLVNMSVGTRGVYAPLGIKVFFELYDRDAGATRFSAMILKKDDYSQPGGAADSVQELFISVALEYMERIADKIGPIGVVKETRGGGEYALLSLGTDAGLRKGTRVQILEKQTANNGLDELFASSYTEGGGDVGPLGRGVDFDFTSVADGRVVESVLPAPNEAWVAIDNFNPKSPQVKRGMAVRLVPVPREERIDIPRNHNH